MGEMASLQGRLRELERVVVGFSGGADSAFLARVATDILGAQNALVVTAVSASLARVEHADCAALAAEWSMNWIEVFTDELDDERYVRNGSDRCSYCKQALIAAVGPLATEHGATVVLGVNLDDLADHRPGQEAAGARGAVFPLVEARFTKADVREESRRLGLRTWDKPAAACLSSRIPYGTPVTLGALGSVEKAEAALRRLGFQELRVRHYGDIARIEVPLCDLTAIVEHREQVVGAVVDAGYRYATLDLEGLRSGNLNGALRT